MDTSRIIINTIDNSSYTVESSTAIAGYTVVESPKGKCRPKKFVAGSAAKLKDALGVTSTRYPELYEVETFNKSYDIYVSSPYSSATVPVAYLTKDGVFIGKDLVNYDEDIERYIDGETDTIPGFSIGDTSEVTVLVNSGYAESSSLGGTNTRANIESATYTYKEGEEAKNGYIIHTGLIGETSEVFGFGKFKNFILRVLDTESLKDYTFILDSSDIKYSEVTCGKLLRYNKNTKELLSDDDNNDYEIVLFIQEEGGPDTEEGKYKLSSYKSTLSSLTLYYEKIYKGKDIKAILFPKYPSSDGRILYINFEGFNENRGYSSTSTTSRNLLKMSVYEDKAFHNAAHPISISGTLNTSNSTYVGFTSSNEEYTNQELVAIYLPHDTGFTSEDELASISGYAPIQLAGGTRTTVSETMDLTALHNIGWEYAETEEYPEVAIFFSSSQNMKNESNSEFFSIASSGPQIAQYSGFIFNETPDSVNEVTIPLNYGRMYWNICNLAVIDVSKSVRIFSPLTGARALMQAMIIDNRWGGVAPMWENSNGLGGQLTNVSPYRMKYKYTKEQLTTLDSYNYNPVIMDRQYGVMVVGQRTSRSGAISDWSYIGHACAFSTFIKEVRNSVMLSQIGKANNPYYRTLRKEQVEQILAPRLEGNNRIWAEGIVDTSTADGVNDIYARKSATFRINIRVKVDIYSEYVELNFYNEDQSTSVAS